MHERVKEASYLSESPSTKKTLFPWSCPLPSLLPLERACLSKTEKFSGPKFLGVNLTKMRRKTILEK